MRVALAIPELVGGGAERVFVDLAEGLVTRGADVDIVVVRGGGDLVDQVPAGVRVVALGRRETVQCVPALRRYLRRERPEGLVSALSHMNLAAILAARTSGFAGTVVVTQHNTLSVATGHATTARERHMARLLRVGYRWADRVVAVSTGVADDLAVTAHIPRSRIDVAYNPVIFDRLRLRSVESLVHPWADDASFRLLVAAGRLTAQKDFAGLLRALALLDPSHRLVLLGDGPERAALQQLAAELGLADRVLFAGFVANPYPWFRRADVFVMSSAWEGLPTVLIEALAFSAPIVATDCPSGPREILAEGRWGALVPVGRPELLAHAVEVAGLAGPCAPRTEALRQYELGAVTDHYLDLLKPRAAART